LTERGEELRAATQAVRAAARVCAAVQRELVQADSYEKKDKSPVTVADYASQAVVCAHLERALPKDRVVGEEDAAELRGEQVDVRRRVAERVAVELGKEATEARVLDWIDLGGASADGERYWTLDPIDGTTGFLRGEQYAVALALIERGEVVLGVLGCPNLPHGGGTGALFVAQRGGGVQSYPLWDEKARGVDVRVSPPATLAEARFCESVESGHSDQDQSQQIARRLGIRSEPYRIDSQCKYAAVARGDASIYLRLPTRKDYREKIWDHAAGKLVVEVAGGRVTDVDGAPLDFTHGRTLDRNAGVVATSGAIHDAVIEAVREALGR
jgi:3'(2'), 5'-bisphosphate nucleotidase